MAWSHKKHDVANACQYNNTFCDALTKFKVKVPKNREWNSLIQPRLGLVI